MTRQGVDVLYVVELTDRVVGKSRGGITCRNLPIGIGAGEQA
jgi:hypothetical protein